MGLESHLKKFHSREKLSSGCDGRGDLQSEGTEFRGIVILAE